jgi:serine/threonine protein kinase
MSVPSTIDQFLDVGARSGLLDRSAARGLCDNLGPAGLPDNPAGLAKLLIREGLLTNFQAEYLLRGKWRGFNIAGRYKVLERLGTGGMGNVYLCEHKSMRRLVALKILPDEQGRDSARLERFHREARAAASLHHPNIVRAYDIDRDGSLHFLVMEYVDGASLQRIVETTGPLAVDRACCYICQAALGLQHAHENGLVHRDVKPGNLLVDREGVVKLLDMGLARFFRDDTDDITRRLESRAVLGTADYIAPEQILDSHTADIRADIYSLGATFYFLLTGKAPFAAVSPSQKLLWLRNREVQPISAQRGDVPDDLAAIIERMMTLEPDDRYQTPIDVAEALAPWAQTAPEAPAEAEMPTPCPAVQRIEQTLRKPTATPPLVPRLPSRPSTPPPLTAPAPRRAGSQQRPKERPQKVRREPHSPGPVPAATRRRLSRAWWIGSIVCGVLAGTFLAVGRGRQVESPPVPDTAVTSAEAAPQVQAQLPDDPAWLARRGQFLAAERQWKKAVEHYTRSNMFRPAEDGHFWFEYAALLLLAGDKEGYRKACEHMIGEFGKTTLMRSYHVARACTLAEISVKDLAQVGLLADGELQRYPEAFWSLAQQGALAYRAGQYESAAALLKRSVAADGRSGRAVVAWLWLALTEQRLGHKQEAQQWLKQATEWLDSLPDAPPLHEEKLGLHLHNWLEAHVLRIEAEALLR